MLEIWKDNTYFIAHRDKILNNHCSHCIYVKDCMGGCNFLESINLCTT